MSGRTAVSKYLAPILVEAADFRKVADEYSTAVAKGQPSPPEDRLQQLAGYAEHVVILQAEYGRPNLPDNEARVIERELDRMRLSRKKFLNVLRK